MFRSAGDAIDAFMAMMVLRTCQQVEGGLPNAIKAKMLFNIVLDFGVGLVPIIGDIADALFRANTRNAVVLEKFLREKGAQNLKIHSGQRTPPLDPTDPEVFDQQMREEYGPPPQYTAGPTRHGGSQVQRNGNGRSGNPHQAPIQEQRGGGGWFSGFGSKKRQPDEEQGEELHWNDPAPTVTDPRRNNTLQNRH
jgi:hypothetical protein